MVAAIGRACAQWTVRTVRRAGGGAPRGWAPAVLAGSGTVGVAAVAHVSGGAAAPSPDVLLVSTLLLIVAAKGAPRWLRSVQAQILASAALQPLLHLAFGVTPARPAVGVVAMLAAHAVGFALGAWWLIRGVSAVLAVPERVLAALQRSRVRSLVHSPTSGAHGCHPVEFVSPAAWVRSTPRRGPPAPLRP